MKTLSFYLLICSFGIFSACSKKKDVSCICPETAAPMYDFQVSYSDTLFKNSDSVFVYTFKNRDFTLPIDTLLLTIHSHTGTDQNFKTLISYPGPVKSACIKSEKININVKITDLNIEEGRGMMECCRKVSYYTTYSLVNYKVNGTESTEQPLHLKRGL